MTKVSGPATQEVGTLPEGIGQVSPPAIRPQLHHNFIYVTDLRVSIVVGHGTVISRVRAVDLLYLAKSLIIHSSSLAACSPVSDKYAHQAAIWPLALG